MSEFDYTQLYIQAELETIAEKTKEILEDPDGYECSACCIEGQPCDVGLAVKVERERIMKLLEGYQAKKCNDYECFSGLNRNAHDWECGVDEMNRNIALIKGEK